MYIPGQPKSTEEQKEAAKKANDDAWWDRVTRDGGGTAPPVFSVEDASESVSMQDAEVVAPTNSERSPFVGDNPPAMLKRRGGPHDLSSNESPTKRRSFDEADSSSDDGETTSTEEEEEDPYRMRSM